MKKILVVLCAMSLVLATIGTASAISYSDQLNVINSMATYMINNQNDDGGWDWTQPADGLGDLDPNSGSTANTAGATARGLVAAYNRTGNTAYLDSAIKTAKYIVDNATTEFGGHKDTLFFKELDQACQKAGVDNSYNGSTFQQYGKNLAAAAVTIFESGAYKTLTWDNSGSFENDIINAYSAARGTGTDSYAGLVPWEVGEWAQALYEIDSTLYATDALNTADLLFDLVIGVDGTFGSADDGYTGGYEDWWWGIGLSGLLEGMATAGSDQTDIDLVVAQLSSMGTYGDFQNAGYYALAMEIAGEKDLAIGAGIDIYDAYMLNGLNNGYSAVYVEAVGEALHGLSNNPVPEPATMLLLGFGLVGLAGFRKKFKK